MKSILHVALISPGGYTAEPFMRAFMNNGFNDYQMFDWQFHKFNSGQETMKQMLIEKAAQMKPDVIFMHIQNSESVDVETYRRLSKISFVVNYTFDCRNNEKTQWLYNLVPILGLVCFSNQDDVDECVRRGHDNAMVLQSSFDDGIYKPSSESSRNGIVFIGNNTENTNLEFERAKERREMVDFLSYSYPSDFSVYGIGWAKSQFINPKEEVAIYQKALIVINHNHFERELYTSDRLWRAMACGPLVLTKYFKGIEKMFSRGEYLDWWSSFEELKQRVDYYTRNPAQTKLMSIRGSQQVLLKHTWTARIKEMMDFIKTLKAGTFEVDPCIKAGAHVIGGVIPGQGGDEEAKYKDVPCDCGKLRGDWHLCECGSKQYQFRWIQNM